MFDTGGSNPHEHVVPVEHVVEYLDDPDPGPDEDEKHSGYILYSHAKFGAMVEYKINTDPALKCLDIGNPFRAFCIKHVVVSSVFDYFIITTIVTNCIFLAMNNPPAEAE